MKEDNEVEKSKKMSEKTKRLVLVGLFGAISGLLMLFEITLPLIPPFIKLDFSELPILLGGFILGPLYGGYIAVIKILLNFILNGTITFGIGEFVNLLGSLCYVLPAVLYYQKHRTKNGAFISLLLGTVTTTIVLTSANLFVMFPLYAKLMNFSMEAIVQMSATTNPWVTDTLTLMIFAIIPFNLFKYGLTSILALLTYKRLSRILPF